MDGGSEEVQASMETVGNTNINAINGHVTENYLIRDTLDSPVVQSV